MSDSAEISRCLALKKNYTLPGNEVKHPNCNEDVEQQILVGYRIEQTIPNFPLSSRVGAAW
jgi:hypothetical protein